VGVAVVLIHDGKLLLGKRNDGRWCIPCGHVEWDESVADAAIRETLEETGLVVVLDEVIAVQSNFHDADQYTVGVWFRGHQTDGQLVPGSDLVEVAYFDLERLPTLKFQTDATVVQQLMNGQPSGSCLGN
jgi:ADP-ribose pyrophosphatase YjhB (NUDIX family)